MNRKLGQPSPRMRANFTDRDTSVSSIDSSDAYSRVNETRSARPVQTRAVQTRAVQTPAEIPIAHSLASRCCENHVEISRPREFHFVSFFAIARSDRARCPITAGFILCRINCDVFHAGKKRGICQRARARACYETRAYDDNDRDPAVK